MKLAFLYSLSFYNPSEDMCSGIEIIILPTALLPLFHCDLLLEIRVLAVAM